MKLSLEKTGKFIARGGSCNVYEYGLSHVLKKNFVAKFLGKKYLQKIQSDYKICQQYFFKFVVPTQFFTKNKRLFEVQDFIQGTPLSLYHLKHKKIRLQFLEITENIKKMKGQKIAPIDLIGLGGIKGVFSNILVTKDLQLKIIDTSLIESKTAGNAQILAIPIMWMANKIQNRLINKFLKEIKSNT